MSFHASLLLYNLHLLKLIQLWGCFCMEKDRKYYHGAKTSLFRDLCTKLLHDWPVFFLLSWILVHVSHWCHICIHWASSHFSYMNCSTLISIKCTTLTFLTTSIYIFMTLFLRESKTLINAVSYILEFRMCVDFYLKQKNSFCLNRHKTENYLKQELCTCKAAGRSPPPTGNWNMSHILWGDWSITYRLPAVRNKLFSF